MNIPTEWSFKNISVATEFDKHVREQLPWYDLVTGIIIHFARHYIPSNGVVYDIGASTGNIGNSLRPIIESRHVEFHAIDNSQEMRSMYKGPGELEVVDAQSYDYKNFDLAICFLCLMFIPVRLRSTLIKTLVERMNKGGAILIVDKTVPGSGYVSQIMTRLAIASKVATGCQAEDIISKELSLCGIQRPLSCDEVCDWVEIFRFGDFAGCVITD